MLIERTAEAVNKILDVQDGTEGNVLRLVGTVTTETVTISQPAVSPGIGVDAAITELDPDNEDHWMPVVYYGENLQLDVDNTMLGVSYRGIYRISKSAGVSDNAFGVAYHEYFS